MEYLIQEPLLKALHSYLLTKPMGEVEALIHGLRGVTPHQSKAQRDGKDVDTSSSTESLVDV